MAGIRTWLDETLPGSPLQRDLFLLLIAVALMTSPFWAPGVVWAGEGYQYASEEVVATDTGLEFADEDAVPDGVPISDDIACSGTLADRACGLERAILEHGPQPIGIESDGVERDDRIATPDYRFVQLDETIYRIGYELDESDENDAHAVYVNLSSAIPSAALHAVSVDADEARVSSTAVEAAEEGHATSPRAADIPNHPIALGDGTYQRVYLDEPGHFGAGSPIVYSVFLGFALGAGILISLSRKVRVGIRYEG